MTSQTDALLGTLLRLVQEHPSAKNQKGNPRLGINARVGNSKRAKAIHYYCRHLGLGTDPTTRMCTWVGPLSCDQNSPYAFADEEMRKSTNKSPVPRLRLPTFMESVV